MLIAILCSCNDSHFQSYGDYKIVKIRDCEYVTTMNSGVVVHAADCRNKIHQPPKVDTEYIECFPDHSKIE